MPSDYLASWQTAKDRFETETGLKKPAEKGKLLFITWRKPSGLEEAFTAIDQVIDGVRGDLTQANDKTYKSWAQAIEQMLKKQQSYLATLETAIEDEKDKAGKSEKYRAFKVLKASLNTVVARAEQEYKSYSSRRQMYQEKGQNELDSVENVLHMMKNLGSNLKSGAAKATQFCKEVLSDPTPANYNRIRESGARDLSQSISNLTKFVYADWADLFQKNKQQLIDMIDDPRLAGQLNKMDLVLQEMQSDINLMGKQSGDSPTNASLAKLGNETPRMPDTATADEVKAAVKHFAGQIKKCSEISAQLLRFG